MIDLLTYFNLITFLVWQKPNFLFFIIFFSLLIMTILYWPIISKTSLKPSNKAKLKRNKYRKRLELHKVVEKYQNENVILEQTCSKDKWLFVSKYIAIFTSGLLVFLTLVIYLNVGYVAFPDHNSFGPMINKREFNNKPSQRSAELFFMQIEEETIPKKENTKTPKNALIISDLEIILKTFPNDIDTLNLLVKHKEDVLDFLGAIDSQKKILEIKGNRALPNDYSKLLDLMITSTKGYISPEAKRLIELILKLEPKNIQAQFLDGLFYAQDGQSGKASEIWDHLVSLYKNEKSVLQLVTSARIQYGIN